LVDWTKLETVCALVGHDWELPPWEPVRRCRICFLAQDLVQDYDGTGWVDNYWLTDTYRMIEDGGL